MFREILNIYRILSREDHPPLEVAGLTVLDLRSDRNVDHDQVVATFEETVEYLREPDPRYFDLVRDIIEQINIHEGPNERVSWLVRQLTTALPAVLRRNPFYLACRLVWAAAYLRALSAVPFVFRPFAVASARKAAMATWVEFAREFPNSEEWEAYLRHHQ